MQSLYEQIGGAPAIDATVELFYEKVMADPALSPFFSNTDMAKQKRAQKAFVSYALGGPQYSGRGLRNAHKKAVEEGLNDNHFNLVAGHLQNTLEELNVQQNLIQQAMKIVGSTRDDVLNKPIAAAV